MADEPDLVALLYRADWTRLSLSAEVHEVEDLALRTEMLKPAHPWFPTVIGDMTAGDWATHEYRARLRVAPVGRYRVDILPVESADENPADRDRVLRTRYGTRPGLPPPYPELLRPSRILNAFLLELTERIEIAGREALCVVATPAQGVWLAAESKRAERIEVIADAETGILLRFEEFFQGRSVQLRELIEVTFEPADEFQVPDDADDDGEDAGNQSAPFSGPQWKTARTAVRAFRTAVNTLGPVLGPAIKYAPAPRRPGDSDDDDQEATMPATGKRFDPAVSGSAPGNEVLHAFYRSGRAAFSGTLHTWLDGVAFGEQARSWTDDHGWGGIGSLAGAVTDRVGSVHEVTRVMLAGDGRYRLEFLRSHRRNGPRAVVSDGIRRWREYNDRAIVGPPLQLAQEFTLGHGVAEMVDTAVLLASHVSNVEETAVGGRRGFALRVVADTPSSDVVSRLQDSDLVVDAELGILLSMTRYAGDFPVMRCEFRDVAPLSADGREFALGIPPGFRVEYSGGGLLDELDMPHPVRATIRTAGSAAKAAESAVQATRGFLDSLRGRREDR
jgi:hypothetical protein